VSTVFIVPTELGYVFEPEQGHLSGPILGALEPDSFDIESGQSLSVCIRAQWLGGAIQGRILLLVGLYSRPGARVAERGSGSVWAAAWTDRVATTPRETTVTARLAALHQELTARIEAACDAGSPGGEYKLLLAGAGIDSVRDVLATFPSELCRRKDCQGLPLLRRRTWFWPRSSRNR
jgi:hypothetical protein